MASLASLLNPSPDADKAAPPKDSLPPIQQVSSHDSDRPLSSASSRSGQSVQQQDHVQYSHDQSSYPASSSIAHEAAQALASLSTSPAPPPTQWNGYSVNDGAADRRASTYELPPPIADPARKMSSPTLDQYHVASKSPEHRRHVADTTVTLAPLQDYAPTLDHRRTSQSSNQGLASLEVIAPPALSAEQSETGHAPGAAGSAIPPRVHQTTSTAPATSYAGIKDEKTSSPVEVHPPDMDGQTPRAVASLKQGNSQRIQSPLRESSVPVPTTEVSKEEPATSKKRPAAKTKKGTASAIKKDKAPPSKKRKLDLKRGDTPSSRASKAPATKGTPLNSSPAPSIRSYSEEPTQEQFHGEDESMDEEREGDNDLYCICRKPDTGTFMIGCDGTCDDWFHGKCVGIEERDKNLIDKYMCPSCTEAGIGRTTFKRMCRRSGCRQPAKISKAKSGSQASKYCSDDCGVAYFRDMVSKSRGREESSKSRAARRKPSLDIPGNQHSMEDDLGARGGALAAGEAKTLVETSRTAEEFKKLGDGVLSPPATPDGKDEKKDGNLTDSEFGSLQRIQAEKNIARQRHGLLKDRLKFVTMAKQAASRAATERELKPKEYCGYDPRLEWTEERFQEWRNSETGRQAFEVESLTTEKSNRDSQSDDDEQEPEVCDRKKCARHMDWSKLATDDLRFEMGDNSDRMRALDREEKEIQQGAVLRARTNNTSVEGSVELHVLEVTAPANEEMELDG